MRRQPGDRRAARLSPVRPKAALAIAALLAIVALALPVAASAAGRVYWTDNTNQISFAGLDGSGGGILSLSGGTLNRPRGVAIDSAGGRIFWVNEAGGVFFAALDGSGGGELNTTGANFNEPFSPAIDPVAQRIYWANLHSISYANLDGSGGGVLDTTGATTFGAEGVSVDHATGRIYWANIVTNEISYANLDGSGGGGALSTSGASVSGPDGVAIDPVTARIYWSNNSGAFPVSYANLDGSGGGNLNVAGGNTTSMRGVAIDPGARRIYWAEEESPGSISYANLDGSGGAVLPTAGGSSQYSRFPILQGAPGATSAPSLGGDAVLGGTLTCSRGSWAADQPESLLYRAPSGFSYQWLHDGADVPGATASSYVATAPGAYACRVAAVNAADATTQTSGTLRVADAPSKPPARGTATVAGLARVKHGKALLRMRCPAAGGECHGAVKLVSRIKPERPAGSRTSRRGRRVVLGRQTFRIVAGKEKLIRVRLNDVGTQMLRDAPNHRLKVKLRGGGVRHRSLELVSDLTRSKAGA
jgi:hypothetical protein